jgi:general secretion pathway protein C
LSNARTQLHRASGALALDWRSERLERLLQQAGALVRQVPAHTWRLLAILLLVIWLSHSLARLFWLLIPVPELPAAAVSANALVPDRAPAGGRVVDIDNLKSREIFGRVDAAAVDEIAQQADQPAQPMIEDQAVDTQLRLELRGVIGSSEEGSARAIIADGSRQAIYSSGDTLPGGSDVSLAKVLERRVILNNSGRYESLWLYPSNPDARRAPVQRSVDPEPVAASRSWEGDEEMVYDTPVEEITDDVNAAFEEGQAEVIEVPAEQAAAAAGQTLSDVVSMSIHREGGQIVGYRIRPGRNSELFHSLGLMADDVVTAVNGTPLDSPGKVMEIYKNMGDANSASLEIRRGGETLSIEIVLD